MGRDKMKEKAQEILLCGPEKLEEQEIAELDAMYYRNKDRGGGALVVDSSGGVLFVDPFFVEFEDHMKRFAAGERSVFE